MTPLISTATQRNWKKLNVRSAENKLTKRANKRRSAKKIIPAEYFSDLKNIPVLETFVRLAEQKQYPLNRILFSVGIKQLQQAGLIDETFFPCKKNAASLLSEYDLKPIKEVLDFPFPDNEDDLLGLIYQCLRSEGEKNITGAYYTPKKIVSRMAGGFNGAQNSLILDPCCGSGAFLTGFDGHDPSCLFGVDIDPLAVMIAKFNMILRFKDKNFTPQIFCFDFLNDSTFIKVLRFDLIITNPPWGAAAGKDGDSFSDFLKKSFRLLTPGGRLKFLLPSAFLNVKSHRGVRELLVDNYRIEKITVYPADFTGVVTSYVSLEASNEPPAKSYLVQKDKKTYPSSVCAVRNSENKIFSLLTRQDEQILAKAAALKAFGLDQSVWGLGIVTGDNKNKLRDVCEPGAEPIYTGKEIRPYFLTPAKKFLHYDRSQLQQTAKDEIYRAPEKLAYKFISDRPVFAYDDTGALFLNSANILIPNVPGMSVKTVLGFLNSELFQFIYMKSFGDIKILKGNLTLLPFPRITPAADAFLNTEVDALIRGRQTYSKAIRDFIYDFYKIAPAERRYIQEVLKRPQPFYIKSALI